MEKAVVEEVAVDAVESKESKVCCTEEEEECKTSRYRLPLRYFQRSLQPENSWFPFTYILLLNI